MTIADQSLNKENRENNPDHLINISYLDAELAESAEPGTETNSEFEEVILRDSLESHVNWRIPGLFSGLIRGPSSNDSSANQDSKPISLLDQCAPVIVGVTFFLAGIVMIGFFFHGRNKD